MISYARNGARAASLAWQGQPVHTQFVQVIRPAGYCGVFDPPTSHKASSLANSNRIPQNVLDEALPPAITQRVQECLRHRFSHRRCLQIALLPAVQRLNPTEFQRLAWIGDATLQYCTSAMLDERYQLISLKSLNRLRTVLVSRKVCAHRLNSFEAITELFIPDKNRFNVHAEVFEAILGALTEDGNVIAAKEFLQKQWPLPVVCGNLVSQLKRARLWSDAREYTSFEWSEAPPVGQPPSPLYTQ